MPDNDLAIVKATNCFKPTQEVSPIRLLPNSASYPPGNEARTTY